MIWPVEKNGSVYYVSARILSVVSDEAGGELFVRIMTDEQKEHEILYTGMYYSQLDLSCRGLLLTTITEIMPVDLKLPKHNVAAEKFHNDCGADDGFLQQMVQRKNRLYMHFTDNGEYLVLAKRMILGDNSQIINEKGRLK